MTTKNDTLVDRENSQGRSTTNTSGRPKDGFVDPELKYPKSEYFGEPSVNKGARGGEFKNLSIKNGVPEDSLFIQDHVISRYPLAQIDESVSGHVIEINDTPGGDRILIMHNSGAGVEMKPDGTIIINSVNNRVEVVNSDYRMSVEGDGNIVYYGNLKMTVSGDYTLDVKGDYNVRVGGNHILDVIGSYRKKIFGVLSEIIHKTKSSTVLQLVTSTYLSGFNSITKGIFRKHVDGEANYLHSGQTNFTSQTGINISTDDLNIAGRSLSVFGSSGTIGGENIIMYSYNSYVAENLQASTVTASRSMKAVEFHGSLKGDALTAGFAQIAAGKGNGARSHPAMPHVPNPLRTSTPTAGVIAAYLYTSAGGIRNVSVDTNNVLFNSIDLTEETGGVTTRLHTVSEVRSRLKNPANLVNSKYTKYHVSNGSLSAGYAKASPNKIGRIRGEDATVTTGSQFLGTGQADQYLKKYKPTQRAAKAKNRFISVDPIYNPQLLDTITMDTRLAQGISIAKFVSSYRDSTTLSHITSQEERKQIARNLIPHAEILKLFYSLKQFDGYNLVIAEGLYRPGPGESVTPNSVKGAAQEGRAVAYELYNSDGEQDLEKLFELAVYLKDNASYEKLSLYYDTYDPSEKVSGQIVITTPVVSETFNVVFNMQIETVFNGRVQSSSDLVEILS